MNQTVTIFKADIKNKYILGSGLELVPLRILDPKTQVVFFVWRIFPQEEIISYTSRERGRTWEPLCDFLCICVSFFLLFLYYSFVIIDLSHDYNFLLKCANPSSK